MSFCSSRKRDAKWRSDLGRSVAPALPEYECAPCRAAAGVAVDFKGAMVGVADVYSI